MSSIDYYQDRGSWGNYQYSSLNEIINNYMVGRDEDDYTSKNARYQILYQAKRGVRELYYDVVKEVRAIEQDLSDKLSITLPPDFVNYVRISWVDSNGQLHPMAVDGNHSIAEVYLQDHSYELLFNDEGCVLKDNNGSGGRLLNTILNSDEDNTTNNTCYSFCNDYFQPNKDFSRVYSNGSFRINKSSGIIEFSSDAQSKSIVLEYISDGLFEGCEGQPEAEIKIHKFAEKALIDFIYYELVKNRRSVPANEKARARKEYYNSRRISKRRINAINYTDLMQSFKSANSWTSK